MAGLSVSAGCRLVLLLLCRRAEVDSARGGALFVCRGGARSSRVSKIQGASGGGVGEQTSGGQHCAASWQEGQELSVCLEAFCQHGRGEANVYSAMCAVSVSGGAAYRHVKGGAGGGGAAPEGGGAAGSVAFWASFELKS